MCKAKEVILTPEEEQAIEEFIEAQFEADLLEEVEDVEVL